jgi:hypothetical protein
LSPKGQWHRIFLLVSAVCAIELLQAAAAQDEPVAAARGEELWRRDDAPPSDRSITDELAPPPDTLPTARTDEPPQLTTPASSADEPVWPPEPQSHDDQILPEPPAPAAEPATTAQPAPPDQELPLPDSQDVVARGEPAKAIGNEDVRAMASAQFGESTILATIAANPTSFDVSPRALVALKGGGVSERVIEAMIAAESAKKQATEAGETAVVDGTPNVAATTSAAAVATQAAMPTEEFTKLSAMIEQLASQQEAAIASRKAPEPPRTADPSPHAWIVAATERTALAPTIAQVAFTQERGVATFKTLHGLANKALAFANPAVGGIATTLGGLFRPNDEDKTAVWALSGNSAMRELGPAAVFEIEFANIPGVDPDKYRPAIVRLVPTNDNYRLIAAAKTDGASKGTLPNGPIIEEAVATEITHLGRGRYRAASRETLAAGQYALVLRPTVQKERKRRSSEASLGELLGGGTSQVLYFTWDFAVAARE